jgi:hypothetical protein
MVIMRLGPVLLLAGVAGCRSSASPPIEIVPAVPGTPALVAAPAARPDDRAVPAPSPGSVTASAGRIALDDARVYWVDAHANRGLETNAPSRLLSAPKAGGAPVELATTPTEASQGIAVDDAFAYVGYVGLNEPNPLACPPGRLCHEPPTIHGPTGAVLAVPKGGGAPRVLASDARDPLCVAADGRQVYWADGASLFRVPREGGRRTLLLANAGCRALALDATHVYCLCDGISRVPKAGGAGEVLVHGDAYEAALAVGPTAVYFDGLLDVRRSTPRTGCSCCGSQSASCREPDPMIDRVPILAALLKNGGAPTPLVRDTSGRHVMLDGRRAYWVRGDHIMGVDLGGGAPIEVADVSGGAPGDGLAVDESRLYWVTDQGELRSVAR